MTLKEFANKIIFEACKNDPAFKCYFPVHIGADILAKVLEDLSADLYKLQAIHAQEDLVRNTMSLMSDPKVLVQINAYSVRQSIKLNTGVDLIMNDEELTHMIIAIEGQVRRG